MFIISANTLVSGPTDYLSRSGSFTYGMLVKFASDFDVGKLLELGDFLVHHHWTHQVSTLLAMMVAHVVHIPVLHKVHLQRTDKWTSMDSCHGQVWTSFLVLPWHL